MILYLLLINYSTVHLLTQLNETCNNLESFFNDKKESYDIFTLKTRFVPAGQKFFSGIAVFHF